MFILAGGERRFHTHIRKQIPLVAKADATAVAGTAALAGAPAGAAGAAAVVGANYTSSDRIKGNCD